MHGIIGDAQATELPEMVVDETMLNDEKKMARYSKTDEFMRIQEHFEAKIAFYQQFLPGGIPITAVTEEERGKYWAVADLLIKEFREVIDMYENAAEAVNDVNSK